MLNTSHNYALHKLKDDFEAYLINNRHLGSVSLHHHDFYEIFFLLSGSVKFKIENYTYELCPGDILLISPTELHQSIFTLDQAYRRIVIYFSHDYILSLDGGKKLFTRCFNNRKNLLRFDSSLSRLFATHAINIAKEYSKDDEYSKIMANSLLVELLVSINRAVLNKMDKNNEALPTCDKLTKVVEYINNNLSSSLSLDLLAEKFFISKYHLLRTFKFDMGTTLHRYITQKRLILAKSAMYSGTSPTGTYKLCGFSDYSSFYYAFKNEYGISPKHFYNIAKTKNKFTS